MKSTTVTYEGLVEENPYGSWSDVSHGVFVGGDKVCASNERSIFDDYIGRRIRVTIQVLPDEEG